MLEIVSETNDNHTTFCSFKIFFSGHINIDCDLEAKLNEELLILPVENHSFGTGGLLLFSNFN